MVVRYLPLQPHCFAFGGFEIQMLSTLKAVQDAGVSAGKLDSWSRDKDFDILHVWGLDQAQYNTVYWAKRAGVKVVITALLPYMESTYEKLRNFAFSYTGNEKYMRAIAGMADAVVVVNEIQKDVAVRYFKAPENKTFEIPNIVNEIYFSPDRRKFSEKYGIEDFVLIAGNVCKRKNQLNLVQACIKGSINLVIVGHVLPGEEKLGDEVQELVNNHKNICWIKGVEPNTNDLANAFFDCSLFALPSFIEQQPISALEAVACGKPLILANRSYANQKYYQPCLKVDPDSVESILEGIKKVKAAPANYIASSSAISDCKSGQVGLHYKEVYNRILH